MTTAAKGKSELVSFRTLLEEKGLKLTFERKQILEKVLSTKGHFDADTLFASLKDEGARIARDTVYRTLPLFLECGVLQKSVGDGRREYFERPGSRGHHDHMVCIQCGDVLEFRSDEIENVQERICKEQGFQLIFHDHRLFGHCKTCRKP